MTQRAPDQNVIDGAWDHVVGGFDWLKSVLLGEFADNRPLSAIVTDMLASFVPGVVILTSARDAVAVVLRLAKHPEKREDLMEWVTLSACLIVIALPLAMAAGGLAAAGVGAVVGGIAGSELGAALRAVMLMLVKEAPKLVELVRFLQKFIKGDVLKFLSAIKFAPYEKALVEALSKVSGKLLHMVSALRTHLESLHYLDSAKAAIATLAQWEKRFYAVQQDALKHIPRALTELDARLAKVLAQVAPKEAHTVSAGVRTDKTVAELPVTQRLRDTPGKVLAKAEKTPHTVPQPKSSTKLQSNTARDGVPKDVPDHAKPTNPGANAKKQAVVDAAAAGDRARITKLSKEAGEAEKNGNRALAEAKIEEARKILRPYLPRKPSDSWDEVLKRLDVSAPKDRAVFWGGTADLAKEKGLPDAAREFAEKIGGVTLETTSGGRIIDGWDEVNLGYAWSPEFGPGPWARDLWKGVSRNYAEGALGIVNLVQTPDKLWNPNTVWHTVEKPILRFRQEMGEVDKINVHVVDMKAATKQLSPNYSEQLLQFDQRT